MIAAGQHDARESAAAFFASVAPWVQTCSRRFAVAYHLDTDDVFQESALAILRGCHGYTPALSAPTTWATAVVRNTARRMRARSMRARLWSPVLLEAQPDDSASETPEGVDRNAIRAAVAELPPGERRVIEWRYLADRKLTLAEVGRHFGVSKQAAHASEARALRRLRDRLASEPTGDRC